MKYCVFGGQFGSEGKGSLAEYFARKIKTNGQKLLVIGENSPNSGHTCSIGKTRNLPASSFYADAILLGPDAVIDRDVFIEDFKNVSLERKCKIFIHEHAALVHTGDDNLESDVVNRISSTGTGSGAARWYKQFHRTSNSVLKDHWAHINGIEIVKRTDYIQLLNYFDQNFSFIFECSQGTLLDVNFGYFPFVTSRSTLPRVAIARNGLDNYNWNYAGVYRPHPIRTGGPSGPTGAAETDFKTIGVSEEVATVTKRIRRVFNFSSVDFKLSLALTRPSLVAFSHLDYLKIEPSNIFDFYFWLGKQGLNVEMLKSFGVTSLALSNKTGHFVFYSL